MTARRTWRVIAAWLVAAAVAMPAAGQMPDLRRMSGTPLPSGDLPDGVVSVRVVRQALSNNVSGVTVTLEGAGAGTAAPTDDKGRAIFSGLSSGRTLVAAVTVEGETVRSQPFQVPGRGGVRLILAVGLGGGGTPAGAAPAAPASPDGRATAPTAPFGAPGAAQPGPLVLGPQTRTIVDFQNEQLEVFHIFEFANASATALSVPQPITISLPADAVQVTLLEGSTPQARVFERQLVVAGPFAPGRTLAQVGYRVPITGPRHEIGVTLSLPLMQTNLILRRLGETRLVAPTLSQSREAQAEGRTYLTGTGPGLPAGGTLEIVVDGLPHHPVWPRYTALGLAGLIVLTGLWVIFRVPVDVSRRIAALDARRAALLTRLQALDQGPSGPDAHARRHALLQDLEGVYALLDAERGRAEPGTPAAPAARRAS